MMAALDKDTQIRCLIILQEKMSSCSITSPTHYLKGIIRNETRPRVPGYRGNGWTIPQPMMHGPPLTAAVVQAVASPQQDPQARRGVKRPAWVNEAWALVSKPTSFMRKMHAVLGGESMSSLSHLPSSIQLSVLMAVVFSEGAWADPVAAVKLATATISSMPSTAGLARVPADPKTRLIVAIQMGVVCGSEWVHLLAAINDLKGQSPDLVLMARHAFLSSGSDPSFYTQLNPDVRVHTDADAFADFIENTLKQELRARDATLLLLITLPRPCGTRTDSTGQPGYHSGTGKNIWPMIRVLKAMLPLPDNRLAYVCVDEKPPTDPFPKFLDKTFGDPVEVSSLRTKVPAQQWRMRSWPPLQGSDMPIRELEDTTLDQRLHEDLRKLRREGMDNVSLPSCDELDEINDLVAFGDLKESEVPRKFALLRTQPVVGSGDAKGKLLTRNELAELWGLSGWNLDESYTRLKPCMQRCDPLTGFQLAPNVQGVACGDNRYCAHCETWYRCLMDSAPAHAFSVLPRLLQRSLQMSEPTGTEPGWSILDNHDCEKMGCCR